MTVLTLAEDDDPDLTQLVASLRPSPTTPRPAAGSPVEVVLAWQRTAVVTAGVVDAVAVDAYTNGQCHALAVALHHATGWPLVWVGPEECCYDIDCAEYDDDEGWCLCQIEHVGVLTPDGAFLDIEGPQTVEPMLEDRYETSGDPCTLQTLTGAQLSAILAAGSWRDPDVATATSFVAAVLDQVAVAAA